MTTKIIRTILSGIAILIISEIKKSSEDDFLNIILDIFNCK